MLYNIWHLYNEKQSIVILEFMKKLEAGKMFCPRVEEVKVPPVCITPPPKDLIIMKIMKAVETEE